MYISYMPLLESSDSVWDNAFTEIKKQFGAIHTEAARIITGATKLYSIDKLCAYVGWVTLQERRNKHKLVILYNIINGLTPLYLHDVMPPPSRKQQFITLETLIICETYEPTLTCSTTPSSRLLCGQDMGSDCISS